MGGEIGDDEGDWFARCWRNESGS